MIDICGYKLLQAIEPSGIFADFNRKPLSLLVYLRVPPQAFEPPGIFADPPQAFEPPGIFAVPPQAFEPPGIFEGATAGLRASWYIRVV